jgi:hypothetical protein
VAEDDNGDGGGFLARCIDWRVERSSRDGAEDRGAQVFVATVSFVHRGPEGERGIGLFKFEEVAQCQLSTGEWGQPATLAIGRYSTPPMQY